MAGTTQATHETFAAHAVTSAPEAGAPRAKRPIAAPARPSRNATDDEILGMTDATPASPRVGGQHAVPAAATEADSGHGRGVPLEQGDEVAPESPEESFVAAGEPDNLRAIFDANPELRRAWQDAEAYRETFATPEEARAATAVLADLDRMDTLFFSRRPEDHAELARAVANLDPEAFASLARAMNGLATETRRQRGNETGKQGSTEAGNAIVENASGAAPIRSAEIPTTSSPALPAREMQTQTSRQDAGATQAGPTPAQMEFFDATNAATVQIVLDAIESQVERLLPEEISKSARNRVVGEIYRELGTSLRSNRQLAQQIREAFRSGALDADHQRAIVSLVTGRARQALPGVAKRVLNEWTSTIVAASQDRRARQHAAERRVDIAGAGGSGNDGRRPMTPRDIDYSRLSDADILNL